jgi:hypothetical protein
MSGQSPSPDPFPGPESPSMNDREQAEAEIAQAYALYRMGRACFNDIEDYEAGPYNAAYEYGLLFAPRIVDALLASGLVVLTAELVPSTLGPGLFRLPRVAGSER